MKISDLKLNDNNPRTITDERFEKLKQSIKEFPKMLKLRPIIYSAVSKEVLAGNMRLRALIALGYDEIPDEWVKTSAGFSKDELDRFIVVDNLGFGEWDMDILANEWEMEDLKDWGFENMPDIDVDDDKEPSAFTPDYRLMITCKSEKELNELYNELKDRDIDIKVMGAK